MAFSTAYLVQQLSEPISPTSKFGKYDYGPPPFEPYYPNATSVVALDGADMDSYLDGLPSYWLPQLSCVPIHRNCTRELIMESFSTCIIIESAEDETRYFFIALIWERLSGDDAYKYYGPFARSNNSEEYVDVGKPALFYNKNW